MTAPSQQIDPDKIEARLAEALAPFDPFSATAAWFDTLRAIEECINFRHARWADATIESRLNQLPILGLQYDLPLLADTHAALVREFSAPFANRFKQLVIMSTAIAQSFSLHGLHHVARHFVNVGTLTEYLMSRRRHFVALLHALPMLCRGRQRVPPLDALNQFLPLIEMQGLPLWGLQQARLVETACKKLGLAPETALSMPTLDPLFLEPERSRITEMPMTEAGLQMLGKREVLARDRLFSAAELRNDILFAEAAYAEFDLAESEFAHGANLVRQLSRTHVERDFWVAIRPAALQSMFKKLQTPTDLRQAFVHGHPSYRACLSTYAPMILVGGMYRSTVTLLSRFIYHWRAVCLDQRKRYQIRSGFIFEKAVAQALEAQSFAVQNITRINRHEFDVVTLRDGTIWNVQCKNNFLDLDRLEAEPDRFAKYNYRLVRSYERALDKERRREEVLKNTLAAAEIEHAVVSRFPVVTDNIRIVPYSRIDDFGVIASAIGAADRNSG